MQNKLMMMNDEMLELLGNGIHLMLVL